MRPSGGASNAATTSSASPPATRSWQDAAAGAETQAIERAAGPSLPVPPLSSPPPPMPSTSREAATTVAGHGRSRSRLKRREGSGRIGRSAIGPAASSSSDSARTTDMRRERTSGGVLSCGTALRSASETKLSSSIFAVQTGHSVACSS